MSLVRFSAAPDVEVEHALGLGRAALGAVGISASVVIVAASLRGDARVLGAYQRAEDALSEEVRARMAVHRRTTGGPSAVAGEGVRYLGLALSNASVLLECPRDRVLNRNVRPILGTLRALGGAAHYFGRELVSLERRPAGLLAWTRGPNGAVLLELFLGVERSFAVPDGELGVPRGERMMGKVPIAAAEVMPAPSAHALAQACAEACARTAGLEMEERALAPEPLPSLVLSPALRWSAPRQVPIGIVRAGLALDDRGVVQHAVLSGDFYQDADAPHRLTAALVGGLPTDERLRDALNATYGPHGAVIEGLRSLQPVLDAFIEVAG